MLDLSGTNTYYANESITILQSFVASAPDGHLVVAGVGHAEVPELPVVGVAVAADHLAVDLKNILFE
jgi:hypothetical protein